MYKAPTSVLTDANGKFVAFGYKAGRIHSDLAQDSNSIDTEDEEDEEYEEDVDKPVHLYQNFARILRTEVYAV